MPIRSDLPKIPVSSVTVDPDTYRWINAIANVSGLSRREIMRSLVISHVSSSRRSFITKIDTYARENALSWEQAFALLSSNMHKTPYGEQDFLWARSLAESDFPTTKEDQLSAATPISELNSGAIDHELND